MDAAVRLGSTSVGLMPLASSATGQGIRARILALQLMTTACDKQSFGPHSNHKLAQAGHTAVSEAMSTLRLRCSEPVRFRLLMGMLNSGGGSGELQAIGIRLVYRHNLQLIIILWPSVALKYNKHNGLNLIICNKSLQQIY